jgi:HEAT repeat protein
MWWNPQAPILRALLGMLSLGAPTAPPDLVALAAMAVPKSERSDLGAGVLRSRGQARQSSASSAAGRAAGQACPRGEPPPVASLQESRNRQLSSGEERQITDQIKLMKARANGLRDGACAAASDEALVPIRSLVCLGRVTVPALQSCLKDADGDIRFAAAFALGRLGPHGLAAMGDLAHALKDPDAGVRKRAALALGQLGPRAACVGGALYGAATRDDNTAVRLAAIRSLWRLEQQPADVVPALLTILADSREPSRRLAAIDVLAEIGAPAKAALPVLKSLAERGSGAEAETAADAVRRIARQRRARP